MFDAIRRKILQAMVLSPALVAFPKRAAAGQNGKTLPVPVLEEGVRDASGIGSVWESLNPGYWRTQNGCLRRRVRAFGDRARKTGFPFHYESAAVPDGRMSTAYDPSLPMGTIWHRHWRLSGNFEIQLTGVVKGLTQRQQANDDPTWRMYQTGYGFFGVSIGGQTQFESFYAVANGVNT